MSEFNIPRNEWEVFSVTYAVPITCPRCGLQEYVHLSEYGEKYKKFYPDDKYSHTITDHCDRCGEQLIVTMSENKEVFEDKINNDHVFKVVTLDNPLRNYEYAKVVKKNSDYELVCYDNYDNVDNSHTVYSGTREQCYNYLFEKYFILNQM